MTLYSEKLLLTHVPKVEGAYATVDLSDLSHNLVRVSYNIKVERENWDFINGTHTYVTIAMFEEPIYTILGSEFFQETRKVVEDKLRHVNALFRTDLSESIQTKDKNDPTT